MPFLIAWLLACGVVAGVDDESSLAGQVRAISAEYDAIQATIRQKLDATPEAAAQQILMAELAVDLHRLGERALRLVDADPRNPEALEALLWLTRRGIGPESSRAWQMLTRDYSTDPRIIPAFRDTRRAVVANILGEDLLRRVLAATTDREVKGQALFALANVVNFRAECLLFHADNPQDSLISKMPAEDRAVFERRPVADLQQEAARLFEQVAAGYADLKDFRQRKLGDLARGELHEMHHLGIEEVPPGVARQPAPEIEGDDADGRRFKLSDYRGQVVVLTFSGNWCGPCVGMYPEERELVRDLKDQPFALLSVNTDKRRESLRESIAAGKVTWRCWWDGEPGGPIATSWGIDAYPTVYILDWRGAIRFKAVGARKLREAVVTLLAEADPSPPPAGDPR